MAKVPKSFKGRLLLDGGHLARSWFERTVVLVCEHNAEGAFGLVLNKPSDTRVEDAIEEDLGPIGDQFLCGGGPVQPTALSFLRRVDPAVALPLATQAAVLKDVWLGHQVEDLVELGRCAPQPGSIRIFAGYAGWSPGQLDSEMAHKSWLNVRATAELIFEVPPDQLWRHLLRRRRRWQERLLAETPEDPSWN